MAGVGVFGSFSAPYGTIWANSEFLVEIFQLARAVVSEFFVMAGDF
jgi:hypothetical protein